MSEPERPISESYWVEPGQLLAGEYPGRGWRPRKPRFYQVGAWLRPRPPRGLRLRS